MAHGYGIVRSQIRHIYGDALEYNIRVRLAINAFAVGSTDESIFQLAANVRTSVHLASKIAFVDI